eukprot:40692-Amphidinium_carterae.2
MEPGPLAPDEENALRDRIQEGDFSKSHSCKGCLMGEGPRMNRNKVSEADTMDCLPVGVALCASKRHKIACERSQHQHFSQS